MARRACSRHPVTSEWLVACVGAYVVDRIWYSDDNGLSYREAESNLTKMDEAQLVELPNGDLLANMRHQTAPTVGRGTSRSTDQVPLCVRARCACVSEV